MSDTQTLLDMGFSKERVDRALQVTNNKGVEPAMEWLLAHADEDIPQSQASETENASAVVAPATTDDQNAESAPITDENPEEKMEAKSLKCDECNRLFKSQMEVEFHAAKSGHSSFSESTEEKKPLTEEEKKAQLAMIEEKLKLKRQEREEREKQEALEREKVRIKSGKDMLEAKKKLEELEMAKIMEQRKREKEEEKKARERVRAQIEADKAARKARMSGETGSTPAVAPIPVTPIVSTTTPSGSKSPKEYSNTKIQIRLPDGSSLTETFDAKEQLSAVRLFIQLKQGPDVPFRLMTSFPRKVFTEEDFEKPLEILGLVPSAVVIVSKGQ